MEMQHDERLAARMQLHDELVLGAEALVTLSADDVEASVVENFTSDTRVQRAVWEDDGIAFDEGEALGLAESIRRSLDLPLD